MLKDVYKYFENLEKNNHKIKGGSISYDQNRMALIDTCDVYGMRTYEVIIDGTRYYAKDLSEVRSIAEIASSQMYNDIGVTTPPVSTVELPKQGLFSKPKTILVNQDLKSIKGIKFTQAIDFHKMDEVKKFIYSGGLTKDRWSPLYNNDLRRFYEQYMTKDCFDDLISLTLVDELRGERDRHGCNYFFYRFQNSDKLQGVVPIDNEMVAVADHDTFDEFMYMPYSSASPIGLSDHKNYVSRVRDIKELIQDSVLSPTQINLIRKEINYDLPQAIKNVGNAHAFKKDHQKAYDLIAPQWEYNYDELSREL